MRVISDLSRSAAGNAPPGCRRTVRLPAHPAVSEAVPAFVRQPALNLGLRHLSNIGRFTDAAWSRPPDRAAEGAVDREALDHDVLADLSSSQPCLVIPGWMTAEREQMLNRFLGSAAAAIGLSVPLSEVAHSVRWARRTLELARSAQPTAGTTPPHQQTARCEDHLLQLWLSSDPVLTQHVADHQLAPLSGLADRRRERLTQTLLAWLSTRGNVEKMSKVLALHPQTVRYRLRALDKTFGPLLDHPEWRLATELVLRDRAASGARELRSP